MLEKQIQYSPHFLCDDLSKQKPFHLLPRELHNECSASIFVLAFAARILWKTQPWDIFAKVHTAKCIASCNHDGSLEDYYCVSFFKLKFLIPIWRHIFCLPKPSKIFIKKCIKLENPVKKIETRDKYKYYRN